jgi:hypothetical protein
LGLVWLSGPGTWVMPNLGIELKKNRKKREGRYNFYWKSNKFINIKNKSILIGRYDLNFKSKTLT